MSFALVVVASLLAADPGGYQNAKWGISREAVRALYPKAEFEVGDRKNIAMKAEVAGQSAAVIFYFTKANKLAVVWVVFPGRGASTQAKIEHYEELKATLAEKYGTPSSVNDTWASDSAKQMFKERGPALDAQALTVTAKWSMPRTTIVLTCSAPTFGVVINKLGYQSEELGPIFYRESRAEDAKDL